ncbi:hypothetical protein ACFE04_012338 [Oxalis oulophora]
MFDNGSSGDNSDEYMFEHMQNPTLTRLPSDLSIQQGRPLAHQQDNNALWSNSSRETWLHGKPIDSSPRNISSLELKEDGSSSNLFTAPKPNSIDSRISDGSSSSHSGSSPKKPNLDLEFTLGRSH